MTKLSYIKEKGIKVCMLSPLNEQVWNCTAVSPVKMCFIGGRHGVSECKDYDDCR